VTLSRKLLTPDLLTEDIIPSHCKVTSMVQPFMGIAFARMYNNLIFLDIFDNADFFINSVSCTVCLTILREKMS